VIEGQTASQHFMDDYRQARNDCFRENFYGTMMRLCHANGLQWHSESGGPWNRNPAVFGEADQLAFLARNDMPQCEFWYTGNPDRRGRQMSRPQSMTAHVYGKRLAAAEAFTHMVRHWTPYPALLKRAGDESFCDGVNQLVWHTFTCSPKEFGWPGTEYFAGTHVNPKVTWFEQAAPFLTYLGRCQHMLRRACSLRCLRVYGRYALSALGTVRDQLERQSHAGAASGTRLRHRHDRSAAGARDRQKRRAGSSRRLSYACWRWIWTTNRFRCPLCGNRNAKKEGVPVVFGKRKPRCTPGLSTNDGRGGSGWANAFGRIPDAGGGAENDGATPDFEGPFEYTHRRDGGTDSISWRARAGRVHVPRLRKDSPSCGIP
jgi:hypothetical protein